MFSEEKTKVAKEDNSTQKLSEIFEDFESRSNLVGFFELLLKVDKRINPKNYEYKYD